MKTGWQTKTLGEICEILDSRRLPIAKKDRISGPYPYYGASGIVDNVASYLFDERLLLLGEDGAKWGAGENSAFIIDGKAWVNNHAHILRVSANILDVWLMHYLNWNDLSPYISGVTVPKLTQKRMLAIPIPLPPLPEQKRIVGILDAAFEKIDTVQHNAERNLANAKELLQRVLDEEMTPKDGWGRASLKEIGMTITGQTPPTKDSLNFGKDIPFIKPADIIPFEAINYQNEGLSFQGATKSRLVRKDSVLMVCIGSIGKVGYATKDVTCNQQINAVIPQSLYCSKFVYYALSSSNFQMLVKKNDAQATLPIISKSKWEALPIDFPMEIKKQESIVCKLDNLLEYCNLCSRNYSNILKECTELKQQVLTQAFNGKL